MARSRCRSRSCARPRGRPTNPLLPQLASNRTSVQGLHHPTESHVDFSRWPDLSRIWDLQRSDSCFALNLS